MFSKWIHRLAALFGVGLFAIAAWVLWREVSRLRIDTVLTQIHQIPGSRVLLAAGLTAGSYLMMTGYDVLALRYIGRRLAFAKTALASLVGYAFSNNIGFAMIAGASVRYRIYSAWGLSAVEITRVVLFCTASLWLGFSAICGVILITEPMLLPASFSAVLPSPRLLGLLLAAAAAGYLTFTAIRRNPIRIAGWDLPLPSLKLAAGQLAIASFDWLMAASVLYALLPRLSKPGFSVFVGMFMLAQLGALISQVPGGLGVFESLIVVIAAGRVPTDRLLGALVVYRGLYYFLPLMLATGALGAQELLRRRDWLTKATGLAAEVFPVLLIPLLTLAVFFSGAVLLFSGALPALPDRLQWLRSLPLPVLEISHFTGSLAGMGLLILARGLQRRLDAAYLFTVGLLGVGILASLLKGLDYEEALILSLVLMALLPFRHSFFRRASLFSERFSAGWVAAIAVVVITSIWLGLFAFHHVEYSDQLWWAFSFQGHAPRFMRATVGILGFAFLAAGAWLLRPATPPDPADGGLPAAVSDIVAHSQRTSASLALTGDKRFLISEPRDAFIMYGVAGQSHVAMGDPVGPEARWPELIWQFRQMADRYGNRAVFYEVGHETLHYYLDINMTLLKLGEEARVPLADFSLEGGARKDLRYVHRKMEKKGCRFSVVPAVELPDILDELRAVSDAWLAEKNTREKGFSLGFFDPAYLARFPAAVVRVSGRIAAFANLWQAADNEEVTVDLMRYRPGSPSGVMDFLFVETMLWSRGAGYRWFNLGMAPLSGMDSGDYAPLWHRIGSLAARFGEHFYNFEGLRRYKEKFDPVWRPLYLASPGGLSLPRILADIGALTSGGLKGLILP
jgi:phosphatidylglycerol lysyltransferase